MKAIEIKYLGATNTQGERVKATIGRGNSITEPYNYGLEYNEQVILIAKKLIKKLDWRNCKISGSGTLPNGNKVVTIKNTTIK